MVAGILENPAPSSSPVPQPSPKSLPSPKSADGSGVSTSGMGTEVREVVLAAITLAIELDGAAGLRSTARVISRLVTFFSSSAPA